MRKYQNPDWRFTPSRCGVGCFGVALFLTLTIFLTQGGLLATPDGLPFSGSQMIIGGVLLLLLVALDAVIACGLFQVIQESRTLYLGDDAGICQIRPFSRRAVVWSYVCDTDYVPSALFADEQIILLDGNNHELMRITHLDNLPGHGYPWWRCCGKSSTATISAFL